jgi:hypothetical protein
MRHPLAHVCALLLLAAVVPPAAATDGPKGGDGPTRPLTDRGRDNLVAFARLLGFVRHFHPSDEVMAADWLGVAVEGAARVEGAESPADLARRLSEVFAPLAPTLAVYPTADGPPPAAAASKGERLLARRHLSVPARDAPDGVGTRFDLKAAKPSPLPTVDKIDPPDPERPFIADLGGSVSCRMPLVVVADAEHTLPQGAAPRPKPVAPAGGPDRATRLAGVVLLWNEAQHFYPYFDVVKTDWPAVLPAALAAAAEAGDDATYLPVLRRLLSALRDGHAAVMPRNPTLPSYPPLRWDWIEDRLAVVRVADGVAARPGDVVVKIDGVPAATALERWDAPAPGATPGFRRRMAMTGLAAGPADSALTLVLRGPDGAEREVTVRRALAFAAFRALGSEPRAAPVCEIRPGVWYVDLDADKPKEFDAALPKIAAAKGVVFDLRGYPQLGQSLTAPLDYLCDKPVPAPPVLLPVVQYPDRQQMTFVVGRSLTFTPKEPRITGKVAFLTDARAISAAETFLASVQHHKLGTVFGSPTAGTNGNVRFVRLPGGYLAQFTGLKVTNYDGSAFHGRGVRPDVPVARTLRGVSEGRDEILEAAVKWAGE